jgi:phosphatidylserine decarboxylase
MKLHRHPAFFRAYRFLPHHALNAIARRLGRATHPRWAIEKAIDTWVRRGGIDLSEYEASTYETVEEFFLRRLRPGARALGEGVISPVDGVVVDVGPITRGRKLRVKGELLDLPRVVNGRHHHLPVDAYAGGTYLVIFLTPDGYHRLHAPIAGKLLDVRWIPGRYYPQNDDALRHLSRIYEKNERATLRFEDALGREWLLVMVGASLIGAIELEGIARTDWVTRDPWSIGRMIGKGEEIGHFTFGSTVVLVFPEGMTAGEMPAPGTRVRMGEPLLRLVP